MANRWAKENFTVNNDFVWVGALRDSASATVTAYPAGFSSSPVAVLGAVPPPLPGYLADRPAGP
jgi:hypothetical protein